MESNVTIKEEIELLKNQAIYKTIYINIYTSVYHKTYKKECCLGKRDLNAEGT